MAFGSLSRDEFSLSDEAFRQLAELIHDKAGLSFTRNTRFILEKRLGPRLRELELEDFEQYYYYLKYDPKRGEEFDRVFDLITTNETYFFREERQLKAFTDEVMPAILGDQPSRVSPLRIWSAGCSSGEEPYTLSMLLREKGILNRTRVDIFASDINHRVLEKARNGLYTSSSFRTTTEYYRQKYFTEEGEAARLNEDIRNLVRFGWFNLYDESKYPMLGTFDVIFCRNVIIYFDQEAKQKVVNLFHQCLRPGGFLLLGHSESLLSMQTPFQLVHLVHDMVYQRPSEEP